MAPLPAMLVLPVPHSDLTVSRGVHLLVKRYSLVWNLLLYFLSLLHVRAEILGYTLLFFEVSCP